MNSEAHRLAELRLLVGYLGEQAPAWWESHFFDATAPAFLTPVFGRSANQARYHGVSEAAGRVHDAHIGVGRTLHLFHMPERYEQAAASVIADRTQVEEFFAHTESAEAAKSRLEAIAEPAPAEPGPMVIGDLQGDVQGVLARMAGLYLDAFRKEIKTYPYVREVE